MHDFINSPATTTTNFGIRLSNSQSDRDIGYNLYTVSGSCGYLLQLTLEALQMLHACKLFDALFKHAYDFNRGKGKHYKKNHPKVDDTSFKWLQKK